LKFTKLPPLMLKGKKEKTEVYKLEGLKSKEDIKEVILLIERESILSKIKNLLLTEGEPLLIIGGAGLGKTEIIEWTRIQCDALKFQIQGFSLLHTIKIAPTHSGKVL